MKYSTTKLLLVFIFLCASITVSFAQNCHTGNAAVWIPHRSYNPCNSRLTLDIHTRRTFSYINYTTTVNGVNVNTLNRVDNNSPRASGFGNEHLTVVYEVPSSLFDSQGKINVYHQFSWSGCGSGMSISFDRIPFQADPTNLIISQGDHCEKIELNWNNASEIISCGESNLHISIERKDADSVNWNVIDIIPYPATHYNDHISTDETSIQKEIEYDYRVRYLYQPIATFQHYSEYSFASGGFAKKSPPKPFDVNASQDNCDDMIAVSWQWNGSASDLSHFRIERKENTPTAEWTSIAEVNGDVRMYEDQPINYNDQYVYRLFALNICDPEDSSDRSAEVIGLMPGLPPEPSNLSTTTSSSSITIDWESPGINTTGFIIERSITGGGSPLVIDNISSSTRSYTDTDIDQCVTYNYKVKARSLCFPSGFGNSTMSALIEQDLSSSFPTDGSGFEASTGYFSNKVELTWTNNNSRQTNQIRIYRRVLGATTPFSLLASFNDDSGIYNDNSAEAGIIYEYEIQAEAPCENITSLTNKVRTVGFRSKSGQVTGNVSYTGGIAVKDVKIVATRDDIVTGKSLLLSGGHLTIANNINQNLNQNLLAEAWVKPNMLSGSIIKKQDAYHLFLDTDRNEIVGKVSFAADSLRTIDVSASLDSIEIGKWCHLGMQIRNDSLYLIKEGVAISAISLPPGIGPINNSENDILIGEEFFGNLKELRIWNIEKSNEEVFRQHSAYASGSLPGMITYLPFDEGAGDRAYDRSQISVSLFNRNHAMIDSIGLSVNWSNDIPTVAQLSYNAYTDEKGNYRIKLPYVNAGETYELVPIYKTHEFGPSNRILFVGDASSVINEVDFEDISSFKVTGSVFYEGMTCPSDDVFILIDGQHVVQQGLAVRSASDGSFSIQVPIGEHVITVEKGGHEFSSGRFPSVGVFDFQEPVTGIEFEDNSKRKIIGRVVGGLREGDKKPGLGLSKNNIGQALLTFDPSAECGWIVDTLTLETRIDTTFLTDPRTGEYEIELPPINFIIDAVEVLSNPEIDFGVFRNIDLSKVDILKNVSDTISINNTDSVLSNSYHIKHDYIYRSSPALDVQNQSGNGPFKGDENYVSGRQSEGIDTIDLVSNPREFPIFTQGTSYRTLISAFESYVNNDLNWTPEDRMDRVPITSGIITIQNELAEKTGVEINLSEDEEKDGFIDYHFIGGRPNLNTNESVPYYSFTKEFNVSLITGGRSTSWMPADTMPVGGNRSYRGYIFGTANIDQSDFVTQGPEVVDYVLRDPPGSQSFATRKKETVSVTEDSWDWGGGGNAEGKLQVALGTKFTTGIGFEQQTKITNTLEAEIKTEFTGEHGKSIIKTTTNSEDWSTSSDPLFTGSAADLYIGTSHNYLFGIATSLRLVPEDVCDLVSVDCFGANIGGFRLAKEQSLGIAQGDVKTQFIYTQSHIERYEIPQLEEIRNQILGTDVRYASNLPSDHPCYGFKNDDPRFGDEDVCPNTSDPSPDHENETIEDRNGPSYIFDDSIFKIDSVRVLNNQINLWKKAIRDNEAFKINEAVPSAIDTTYRSVRNSIGQEIRIDTIISEPTHYNVSFSGGGSSYTRSLASSRNVERRDRFEFSFDESLALKIGFESGGNGVEEYAKVGLTQRRRQLDVSSTDSINTISYTLMDNGEHDDFSVDVFEGNAEGGPVFKTLAGRTSCPHEDTERSKYYRPGTILSPGTIQLEQPEITISPSVLYNVPQSSRGVFRMDIANNNPVGNSWEYGTQLIKNSNPNSANVNVGFVDEITSTYVIPAGTSISRDLFVEIGNGYNYDSLLIVMHSVCQYKQGTSAQKDIADSAYISIHYIPECTPISLAKPTDQWVVNNSHEEVLDIIVDDYDINHLNFNSLQLEYKPSNQADWIKLQKYYKDTTDIQESNLSQIPQSSAQTFYQWDVSQIPDGPYDLRATTDCEVVQNESLIYSGYIDRVNPHPFGTPSPADGVLDPEDDIILQLNEPAAIGSITNLNFDVRGVLNGSETRHETSLSFDGIDDYAEITDYQLQKRSLTVEAWVRRITNGAEVLFSQGIQTEDQLLLSFDANAKVLMKLGNQTITSSSSISDDKWHHIAITYDRTTQTGEIFIDYNLEATNNSFIVDFTGTGNLFIGKDASSSLPHFEGFVHGLRLWNTARTASEISKNGSRLLSGRASGLIGSWQLNEGNGNKGLDDVRGRHAQINGCTWSILPPNHSYHQTNETHFIASDISSLGFDEETDITLETWFKTSANQEQSLFANGRADGTIALPDAWDVFMDSSGAIVIENNGNQLKTTDGWNDGLWHHFAVVIERTKSIALYLDGSLVTTGNSSRFGRFAGPLLSIGARTWREANADNVDRFFNGSIDDVRIWNTARQSDQIKRDRYFQLRGDELGLQVYYPFDGIIEDLGIKLRTPVLSDESFNDFGLKTFEVVSFGDNSVVVDPNYSIPFNLDAPPIQLPRLVEKVNFTYSLNNDEVYIALNEPPARIENTILDITVRGIRDHAGNTMQSPKTWTAYIDKNQVFWEREYFQSELQVGEEYEFVTKIVNTGGRQERFSISNLPSWLAASPNSGIIEPNSTVQVTLKVSSIINLGSYEQDVYVSTESFGYNERLLLDLKVKADPPNWEVQQADYTAFMNYIGEVVIDGIISTDPEDMVIAIIDDTIRGLGNVQFVPGGGKHLVYLDINGFALGDLHPSDGENISFFIWDASEDKIYDHVTPSDHVFIDGELRGSPSDPVTFESSSEEQITLYLKKGWNWISFPAYGNDLENLEGLFDDLDLKEGNILTDRNDFAFISAEGEWVGSQNLIEDGLNLKDGYQLLLSDADTFSYSGVYVHPTDYPIPLNEGWTPIGMISEYPIDITSALANLNPNDGDWIKGNIGFAVYELGFGWTGTLNQLNPKSSYLIKMAHVDTLIYPVSSTKKSDNSRQMTALKALYTNVDFKPELYNHSMSMVVTIDGFDKWTDDDQWFVAAYQGAQLRGINEVFVDLHRNKRLGYLQLYSNQENEFSFKLISKNRTQIIDLKETYWFEVDGTLGSPHLPETFTLGNPCLANIETGIDYRSFITSGHIIQANYNIKISSKLKGYNQLSIGAGEAIELKTGFESLSGNVLELNIKPCRQ